MFLLVARITTLVCGVMFAGWDAPTDDRTSELVLHGIGGGLLTIFVLLTASQQSD